ncbi:MAG: T9SS type A sorting domain-containing protein, partial [Calditrichia bacterium]|nr:T9SS type A sorting domain-containing protein [Calditrichia bacterium]
QLKDAGKVELTIFNSLGQKVTTLVSKTQTLGTYTIDWDASAFASGIYYCHLKAGNDFIQTKKMVLMR